MNIEDLLREAAPGANDLFLSELPDPKDCHYTVSKRFERKMKKLLKRQKSPVLYWVQRSVACFLLVVLLGGASVLTFSAEARAAFFGWVREVYETYFVYQYNGNEQTTPEEVIYRPNWLPEGYQEIIAPKPGDMVRIVYQENGNLLSFSYTKSVENASVYIEYGESDVKNVFVGNASADLMMDKDGGANILTWVDEEKGVFFWISGHLSEEDLIKIAESVNANDEQ